MIELGIEGVDRINATLKSMLEQVERFGQTDMPNELTVWQTDDMHRKRPNTTEPEPNVAMTMIYQRGTRRSRTERPGIDAFYRTKIRKRRRRRKVKVAFKIARRGRRKQGKSGPSAARPILRPVLYDELQQRMNKLLTDKLKWQTSA